ncbi:SDR family NAD(P)-dependent oxidoreductase [Curtobacterium sp. NPDC089689]|uniref:SDR family NAD(P)-dependent oxidoreductase n=1 Tax=Curtobacterium sp. NPDC089689 TaxID=3363968 RepID=UPI003810D6C2
MSNNRFTDQTVIVTGAGSGIGRATALRLLGEGADVVGTDVAVDRLSELGQEANTTALTTVPGDVADAATIADILDATGGRVDALANVAGIMDGFLPAAEIDDATWDRVFAVNVTGPMRLTRAVLPRMLEQQRGSIVNVASEAALRASASGVAYAASKHALVGLTQNVAFYYGPSGIRSNAVAPGGVATNIEAPMKSEFAANRVGPILHATMPAPTTADRLAAAITWLLSDDSANVNGVILPSDGGWAVA